MCHHGQVREGVGKDALVARVVLSCGPDHCMFVVHPEIVISYCLTFRPGPRGVDEPPKQTHESCSGPLGGGVGGTSGGGTKSNRSHYLDHAQLHNSTAKENTMLHGRFYASHIPGYRGQLSSSSRRRSNSISVPRWPSKRRARARWRRPTWLLERWLRILSRSCWPKVFILIEK